VSDVPKVQLQKPLKIVDAREPGLLSTLLPVANERRNFIIILKSADQIAKVCDVLQCSEKLPERLTRLSIVALADVLEPGDYTMLLENYENNFIYFVEQLRLALNQPPSVLPFLLYCEIRGIISDHETLEDAGSKLLDYLDSFKRARLFPLAGIYQFEIDKWVRVRRFSSPAQA
jgi:hypothetical protein